MSKLRHTLQLLHGGGLSTRQISAALGISKSTVSEIASYARAAGVDWALAQTLSDEELQARTGFQDSEPCLLGCPVRVARRTRLASLPPSFLSSSPATVRSPRTGAVKDAKGWPWPVPRQR